MSEPTLIQFTLKRGILNSSAVGGARNAAGVRIQSSTDYQLLAIQVVSCSSHPGSVAGEDRGHNANSHTRILDKVLGRSVKCRAIGAGLYILWSDLLITA